MNRYRSEGGSPNVVFFSCVRCGGGSGAEPASVRACVRPSVRPSVRPRPAADQFCSGVTFSKRFVGIMVPVQGFSSAVDSCRCPLHIFSMKNAGWRARSCIRPHVRALRPINFALVLRFPRDLLESRFSCKVFHANLTQERSHCSGVTLGR